MSTEYPTSNLLEPNLQRAGRLYRVVIVLMLVYAAAIFAGGGISAKLVAPFLIAACGALALQHQARHSYLRAMQLFVWGVWGAVTLQAVIRNGLSNPALYAYPALFLLGGWVLGVRQGVALGVSSILATLLIAMAEQQQWLTKQTAVSPMEYWIPMAVVLAASMAAMRFILSNHWDDVRKTQELNQQLELAVATLSAHEKQLEKSEQRFHTMIDASPLAISLSRLDNGNFLTVNPSWERVFGWSRAQAEGKNTLQLGCWLKPELREIWIAAVKNEKSILNYPMDMRTAQGQIRSLLLCSELIDYDDRSCVLTIAVDQTDRIKVENEVRALNEQLEYRVRERTTELREALQTLERAKGELVQSEKLASLGQLVAGVAHELNTPLGNALTSTSTVRDLSERFAEQLKSGGLKKSQLEAFIAQCVEGSQLAERSMHRASALVQSFKQVAIDQSSERKRPFDLDAAVTEVVDTLRPNLKNKPWKIDISIPKDLRMDSYPGPLGQIVINLVMNASLHAFEDRDEGTITFTGKDNGDGTLTLICADDGRGIAAENLGRVFDPFFTTKLGQGGSGLGLSIVYRIATQILQGSINVRSEEGAGTVFTLRLPMQVAEQDPQEQV